MLSTDLKPNEVATYPPSFVWKRFQASVVSPGFVQTEFSLVRFKGNEAVADGVYDGFVPLSAADCADSVLWIATRLVWQID
jgi:NADP-dependent 3-hydroxy acid dehydrogenase YdfG